MAKKNLLTDKEAQQILEQLKKSAKPSERLKKYVHNTVLADAHILFQYKEGNTRYGFCTGCGNDFVIEIKAMRTYTNNDVDVLMAKHNEKVVCPCCGRTVTKRYAGISRPDMFADVAEFKVDKSGDLIVYVYRFSYEFSKDFHICTPSWTCWQIGYFDLHKYCHMFYSWWNENAYTGDRYTNQLLFTNKQKTNAPFYRYQSETEGIKCFEPEKALLKSNLKYSSLMEYMGETNAVDMFKYLKFYCSYPEITERLMKQGYNNIVEQYFYGCLGGCFNFKAKTVPGFFKLDKLHLKALGKYGITHKTAYCQENIKAMQFMKNNNLKLDSKVFSFLSRNANHFNLIQILLLFMGIKKAITYINKQGALCACHHSCETNECLFFENYKDYIKQCKMLEYDISDKNIAVPMNLFQAHQQLTEILNQKKAEEEAKIQAEKMKSFKKRLLKLKDKYYFTDGNLLIRPAEDYKDLQKEGTTLHHCVYSDYADKYIEGKTNILLIRRASEPDKPFYTMEYKNGNVVQCRTTYNGGMTDEVKAFIKKWKAFMKANNKKKKKEAA